MDNGELISQIQSLPADDFWLITGAALALAAAGAAAAFLMFKRARLIEDTPTSRIRSAAQGHVELEGIGRLLPGEPIVAPLSRVRCLWWKYSIEERRGSGKNSRWVTLDSGSSDEMFELDDDTDRCVIDPEGAKVIPDVKLRWYGRRRFPRSAPAKSPLLGFGGYRYREERITPGKPLYALGWFRTEGGVAQGLDEDGEVRDLLRDWKRDQAMLLREFDADGDGEIDLEEWEAARRRAIETVRRQQLERATHPDLHVLCRPPRRLKFLLSTVPQAELIRRSRRYAVLGLAGFFVGGGLGVWLLAERGLLS